MQTKTAAHRFPKKMKCHSDQQSFQMISDDKIWTAESICVKKDFSLVSFIKHAGLSQEQKKYALWDHVTCQWGPMPWRPTPANVNPKLLREIENEMRRRSL